MDYAWLETQDTFNSLLKDLNEACGSTDGSIPEGPPPDSVLKDSKKNRKRGSRLAMFESRFRKGKDLSLMKADDLAAILGQSSKRPERLRHSKSATASAEASGDEGAKAEDVTGLTCIPQKESVADYFAQKMAEKKQRAADRAAAEAATDDTPSDDGPAVEPVASASDAIKAKKEKKKSKKKAAAEAERGDDAKPKRKADDGEASSKKKRKKKRSAEEEGDNVSTKTKDKSSKKKKKKSKKGLESD
jgi:hypothetical protein